MLDEVGGDRFVLAVKAVARRAGGDGHCRHLRRPVPAAAGICWPFNGLDQEQ
jgi:hypothetical protein